MSERTALDRWLTIPERWPGRTIAAIGLLFVLTYGASLVWLAKPNGRIVIGDAVHYYVYLRSIVFDGDLRFRNEYVQVYGLRGGEAGTEWVHEPTATGHTRNLMSIGPAIAWAPLYLVVTIATWLSHAIGGGAAPDGYGRLFQASTGISGVLAATAGAYLAYRAAAVIGTTREAIWATLVMWLGSHAIYYSLVSPTYSHAISMLTVGLFIVVWLTTRPQQTVGRYALVGALGGMAALVRWQDAVLLIVPAIDAAWHATHGMSMTSHNPSAQPSHEHSNREATADTRHGRQLAHGAGASATGAHPGSGEAGHITPSDDASTDAARTGTASTGGTLSNVAPTGASPTRAVLWRGAILRLVACGIAASVAFLPQMLVWQTLYGSPFLVPQGDEFMRWTAPALVSVLFSDWHGLFTWTPIIVVSLVGLVMLGRRDPLAAIALGAALLVSWYANAAVADWWAGEAYGARRFVSCFPIFAIGLACAIRPVAHRLRLLASLAAVVIVLNGLLLLQYQTFMHGLRSVAPYPRGAYELWLARFVVPFELIRRWLQ